MAFELTVIRPLALWEATLAELREKGRAIIVADGRDDRLELRTQEADRG